MLEPNTTFDLDGNVITNFSRLDMGLASERHERQPRVAFIDRDEGDKSGLLRDQSRIFNHLFLSDGWHKKPTRSRLTLIPQPDRSRRLREFTLFIGGLLNLEYYKFQSQQSAIATRYVMQPLISLVAGHRRPSTTQINYSSSQRIN